MYKDNTTLTSLETLLLTRLASVPPKTTSGVLTPVVTTLASIVLLFSGTPPFLPQLALLSTGVLFYI